MGAILGKSKSSSSTAGTTVSKVNGHKKETLDIYTHQNGKTGTLEKKSQKKELIKKKKSTDEMIDKCTGTDGEVISSSAYIRRLVTANGCYISNDSLNGQGISRRPSDTPSKDVLELRDACIRRGIITPETSIATLPTAAEQGYEVNIVEEPINDTPTTNVVNDEEKVESQTTNEW
ncbi:unnamed protein product [Adineta ricciae]|uniref:Uncharacterized protein n=1 Tax=Adineta ricciae TaxID=249248 RepID=A0A815TRS4_ADIRI|nr:unnamed protein product [Adineta ricciae]